MSELESKFRATEAEDTASVEYWREKAELADAEIADLTEKLAAAEHLNHEAVLGAEQVELDRKRDAEIIAALKAEVERLKRERDSAECAVDRLRRAGESVQRYRDEAEARVKELEAGIESCGYAESFGQECPLKKDGGE